MIGVDGVSAMSMKEFTNHLILLRLVCKLLARTVAHGFPRYSVYNRIIRPHHGFRLMRLTWGWMVRVNLCYCSKGAHEIHTLQNIVTNNDEAIRIPSGGRI